MNQAQRTKLRHARKVYGQFQETIKTRALTKYEQQKLVQICSTIRQLSGDRSFC